MRRKFAFALFAIPLATLAAAQQAAPPTPLATAPTPAAQTVYYAGPGVVGPELLPGSIPVSKIHRYDKLDGAVTLTAVVDASGIPHDVASLHEEDALLGNFAVKLIEAEHFKPGTYNGSPSPVAIMVTLGLQTCIRSSKSSGSADIALVLKTLPEQSVAVRAKPQDDTSFHPYTVGGPVSAPVPISDPDPSYSVSAKRKKIQGTCWIGLIVDVDGVPQNVRVVKSLEPSLDQKAAEAVETWRFKPAIKDGTTPVPVKITVELSFHLY